MTSPSKIKGSQFERDGVAALRPYFPHAERSYGAGRPFDVGDIDGTPGLVWELKACKRFELASWMDEAERERENANAHYGILVVKRRLKPASEAFAILPLAKQAQLLREAGY